MEAVSEKKREKGCNINQKKMHVAHCVEEFSLSLKLNLSFLFSCVQSKQISISVSTRCEFLNRKNLNYFYEKHLMSLTNAQSLYRVLRKVITTFSSN